MQPGLFQMKTAKDLFAKLEWEFENFRKDPSNPWIAFNFFVTAEHLPDWINRKDLKGNHSILRICSHLANSGKHYKSNKKSVVDAFRNGVVDEDVCENGVFEEWLTIRLPEEEANTMKTSEIDGIPLAEKVVEWWRNYFRDNDKCSCGSGLKYKKCCGN